MIKNNHHIVLFSSVFILFFFKYPLNGFFGTGIRSEDIVIFLSFVYFLLINRGKLLKPNFIKPFICYVLWSVLVAIYSSVIIDSGLGLITSLVFTVRHVEYLMLFYIGTLLKWDDWINVLKWFVIYEFLLVSIQKFGFIGFGTLYNVFERQVGSTGGPWELAVMICMPLFLFLRMKAYPYVIACVYILYSTQSRITIAAVLVVLTFSLIKTLIFKNSSAHRLLLFSFVSLVLSSPVLFNFEELDLIQRMGSVANVQAERFEYMQTETVSAGDFKKYDTHYIKPNISTTQGDASAYSRFSRWNLAVQTVNSYGYQAFLFGMGPSFFGNALDGAFVRLFVTTGAVGFFLFAMFYFKLFRTLRIHQFLVHFFIVYLISAVFIDVFYSIKINIIFWFTFGSLYSYEKNISYNKIR